MKILIVLPDLRGGGAERVHLNLAARWMKEGINVDFALMKRSGELLDLVPDGVEIFDFGVSRIRHLILPLSRLLRKTRPDVVVAAMWPLTSATVLSWRLAGKPGRLFLSDHTQLSLSAKLILNEPLWIVGAVMRLTYPAASGIIAVSEGVKEDMCRLAGLAESRIRVIYNPSALGIDSRRADDECRNQLWGPGYGPHILSVGALKAEKDHATLIKAFAQLPSTLNAKLTILGEGSLRKKLEGLAKDLGVQDRVAMPGFVVDPYPWFRSADLFVLSSHYEGFGNVIVEALECGLPIVSTDCQSGPAEILANGKYGRLVPPKNPTALSKEIAQALEAPVDRELLMRRAQDFAVSVISDQYLAYFGTRSAVAPQ